MSEDVDSALARMRAELAVLSAEKERLLGERAHYFARAAQLEEHNRLLTESATEYAQAFSRRRRRIRALSRIITDALRH
jgi:hypothetical protein